ncbi:E3 SUMO-protein ligase ZBED1-like isoform X1 [Acanthochromis polyacanthus]|uniref:E3 SUMO-protein ligase ZBED1-like isoform X1 n=1 Tax=Acanthochromis polyacanthus TaxID=80966 RepID=UPI0022348F1E|nr:E3 SUMO-protein ligase ZBED1-like isoform X1 [Acanthochromis polyacanthus]
MKRIHQLYSDERTAKEKLLAEASYVALTGDHWTSISNHNYLGVTAHLIDRGWKLKSFALTVSKTVTRHYADACAEQFDAVTKEWEIENKVTTIGTDSARNMVAAARQLPFDHIPCAAHMLQRTITACLEDNSFGTALAKCRKIVGHFRHSPASTEELHQQQTALGQAREPLVQDVSTRWNSTLSMISRYLRNHEAVNATLATQKHKLATLTNPECDKLQKLEAVLEPCNSAPEWSSASQLTPLRQSTTSTAPGQLRDITLITHLNNKNRLILPLPARLLNKDLTIQLSGIPRRPPSPPALPRPLDTGFPSSLDPPVPAWTPCSCLDPPFLPGPPRSWPNPPLHQLLPAPALLFSPHRATIHPYNKALSFQPALVVWLSARVQPAHL